MKSSIRSVWKQVCLCIISMMIIWVMPVTANAEITVAEKTKQVVREVVTTGMSETDIARALHDWLTDHAYYDLTYTYHDPKGVLLYQTGVCQSYSEAYQLLLAEAGIESRVLTGNARKPDGTLESHAWNLVKVDGQWKHVDVTWDDPTDGTAASNVPLSGQEHHIYFLVDTSFILTDHMPDEKSQALLEALVGDEVAQSLPSPVATKAIAEVPDFNLQMADGTVLTKSGYGNGKKLMMLYGRTTCLNTTAFLSGIISYISQLKNHGITVLLALYDNPSDSEMKEMASRFPGIVCARVTEQDNSMWQGLSDMGENSGSIIFPVIFLKNAQNALTFYSVGYVEEPLKIVSGALQMNEDKAPATATGTEETKKNQSGDGSQSNGKNQSGSNQPNTGTKTKKTTPAKVKESITISKVPASVKAKVKKNKVTVSWKKIKKNKAGKKLLKLIKSIQVQYSTDPKFKQNVKTKTVGRKKTKVTLKLGKKTTYYFRVRYKGANGFSKWSKTKKAKTKK